MFYGSEDDPLNWGEKSLYQKNAVAELSVSIVTRITLPDFTSRKASKTADQRVDGCGPMPLQASFALSIEIASISSSRAQARMTAITRTSIIVSAR